MMKNTLFPLLAGAIFTAFFFVFARLPSLEHEETSHWHPEQARVPRPTAYERDGLVSHNETRVRQERISPAARLVSERETRETRETLAFLAPARTCATAHRTHARRNRRSAACAPPTP